MPDSFNGKKRKTYQCVDHIIKTRDGTGAEKEIFVKGCGFVFKTCGNPQTCPKCHVQLPIAEKT